MEAKAIARSVRQSPRKIRKTVFSIKKLNVDQALNHLHFSKEKAAKLGPKGRASFVKRKRADQKKAGDSKKGGNRSKGKKPTFSKTGA